MYPPNPIDVKLDRLEELAALDAPTAVMPRSVESGNAVRPDTWDDIVGQDGVKRLLARIVRIAMDRRQSVDHMLFVGPSGTGKTTFAHVIANELDSTVYQLEAPVSTDTLRQLASTMQDGDILFLDEIHQQAIAERRGKSSATQPEVLFSIMEDFTMPTETGVITFPRITLIGATTDEGMLPDAFVNRFPIRPRLDPYTEADMTEIAERAAVKLDVVPDPGVSEQFARASRGVPREVINFVRNAAALAINDVVDTGLASEVIHDLNGVTADGLTRDMQGMLTFLFSKAKRITGQGDVRYQASIGSIATAIGKSRDQKAVALRVEPYLIEQGYVQVLHGGRALTDNGQLRAARLLRGV